MGGCISVACVCSVAKFGLVFGLVQRYTRCPTTDLFEAAHRPTALDVWDPGQQLLFAVRRRGARHRRVLVQGTFGLPYQEHTARDRGAHPFSMDWPIACLPRGCAWHEKWLSGGRKAEHNLAARCLAQISAILSGEKRMENSLGGYGTCASQCGACLCERAHTHTWWHSWKKEHAGTCCRCGAP
jgi:hypothetical protein